MALASGDALVAFSFEFTVDGETIPNVVAVNNISQKTQTVETKSMTPDGQYVIQHMLGPRQSGSLQLSVLSTGDSGVTQWLMQGIKGDSSGARKTGKLVYRDTTGAAVLTQEFSNLVVTEVNYGNVQAGGAEPINLTITMAFTEMETS
jgi:phage tail-like protein